VPNIHPTAIVDSKAVLADTCTIGPYAVVGPQVTVGEDTEIANGCHLTGQTTIGRGNQIFPYCCIGTPPQDLGYEGEAFAVEIGDHNVIREFSTINIGTGKDRKLTSLGNHNFLMAYSHIGHDCDIGNHIVLVNNVGLAGHSAVEDHAIVSGLTGCHHYVTIGRYAFVGGMSGLAHDAPPYMTTEGRPAKVHRPNIVGLQRHGFSQESIDSLKRAHRIIYRSKLTRNEAFRIIEGRDEAPTPEVRYLIDFLKRQMAGTKGRQREARRQEKR
jgi:UDP-N-acetylglucosamine acyltransferase